MAGVERVDNFHLGERVGVANLHSHHETVELRLGKVVGSVELDGVLGSDNDERIGHRVRHTIDGYLMFFHDLKQRRLGLGRGAVDLIAEDDVGKNGAWVELELVLLHVVDLHAGDVGGEQIGCELDAGKCAVDRLGHRTRQRGFACTGDILDQEVSFGQHADEGELHDIGFALDDGFDVVDQPFKAFGEVFRLGFGRALTLCGGFQRGSPYRICDVPGRIQLGERTCVATNMGVTARGGIDRWQNVVLRLSERIDATSARRRLDVELVRRRLVDSREQAKACIEAGSVTVGGVIATKPARQVLPGDAIELRGGPPRYVSRGGFKLAAALEQFGLVVSGGADPGGGEAGLRCLDAGSSTGGFTDALLQAGAELVVAVDVGTHQLHERLRDDSRVELHEQTDIRSVSAEQFGGRFALVVADLSFISLHVVLAELLQLTSIDGDVVVLVKPQFEAGRQQVSRGRGVITDPDIWRETLLELATTTSAAGAVIMGLMSSPIRGGKGNTEFLLHLRHGSGEPRGAPLGDAQFALRVDEVIAQALTDAGREVPAGPSSESDKTDKTDKTDEPDREVAP